MATSAITGLTTEQEAERQRLASKRGQDILGGLASSVYSLVDPTDPLNYLGLFGKVGRAMALAGTAMSPTQAEAVVGKRFIHTGVPTNVPMFGKAYEISDKFSSLNPAALERATQVLGGGAKLKDILSHPSLYRDYPEISNLDIKTLGLFSDPNTRAAYGGGTVYLPPTKQTVSTEKLKEIQSSLLHEVQHAIQEIDKMPKGASPTQFLPEGFNNSLKAASKSEDLTREQLANFIESKYAGKITWADSLFNTNKFKELIKDDKDLAALAKQYDYSRNLRQKLQGKLDYAHKAYEKTAGEAQARAVQKRFMEPEQYANPFTESYDLPLLDITHSPLDFSIK